MNPMILTETGLEGPCTTCGEPRPCHGARQLARPVNHDSGNPRSWDRSTRLLRPLADLFDEDE